jgi:hypothetical protein
MARSEQREPFDQPTRLRLLENDADVFEARFDKIDARLGKIMATCLSILVSLVVASILLAVNLAVGS